MRARSKGTVLSLVAVAGVMGWVVAQSACSSDTSGTGDCDPSTSDCPAPDRDSSVGVDSARADSAPRDTSVADSTIADSTAGDTTVGDTTATDSAVADSTTDSGVDATDATTDATDARTDTTDAASSDATDAGDTALDAIDATDARDAGADVATDTRDAAAETSGDSGLFTDPMNVRCRSMTNCILIDGDVCCTPKPDGGVASPWRCWDKFTCVAGTGMTCDESADCTGTDKCCASSTSATASTCQATCSGIQLCMTNAECGSGKSCVPFSHVSGATLGSCSP